MAAERGLRQLRTRGWRRPLVFVTAAAVVLVIIVTARLMRRPVQRDQLAPLPSAPAANAPAVVFEDFIGSDVCAECHAEQHTAWSGSTHARAGEMPPGKLVLRRFDGTAIRFRDATVEPRMTDTTFEFVVQWAGGRVRYPIAGVVGAAHMMGGGTQGFVWRHPDGTMRLLPFEIAGDDRAWFCSTGTRGRRGWTRITPELSIADCHDWPPARVLGSSARFVPCQECHASQLSVSRGPAGYETRVLSLAINCESCHGPARRHVASARAGRGGVVGTMRPLATLSRDESIRVCMSCHALKVELRSGYLPGTALEEHYSLKLPLLGGDEVHPDGRTRAFAYQQGHYYSDCYLSGSMTCIDCHAPHDQRYRDITGRALPGRLDDAQCTACHASKAQQPEQHSRHPAQSPGSRCVACHMPFVQESAVGSEIRYQRADHTISIPRPELDEQLGVVNACRTCHAEWSNDDVARDIRRLWGEQKPLRPVIATLLAREPGNQLHRALMDADTLHRFAYFAVMARQFAALDAVDTNMLPRRVRARLWQLTESADPDIAALALATLHLDGGRDAKIRARLVERLNRLGERDAQVRRRWAVALGHRADSYRNRQRGQDAIAVYAKALELLPDDPAFLLALALAHFEGGNLARATELLQRLLALEPRNALAWMHYGRVHTAAGDARAALAAYGEAVRLDPYDAAAHFHRGSALLRAGRQADAAAAYRRAAELDASMAPAHFNLARLLLLAGDNEAAIPALRAGLTFDPTNREARDALDYIEAQRGGTKRLP